MSKEIISNGEDFIVEWVDRRFVGVRRTALKVNGNDGSVGMGALVVDKNGNVSSTTPVALAVYSNSTRPAASSVAPGSAIFNSDDNAPNYSNGSNWYDAVGNLT